MSPRRSSPRPRRRRIVTASTDAVQRTSRHDLVADVAHEGLAVTNWFDPGRTGDAYPATVTFRGRRDGLAGKAQPGDTFTKVERIARVVPGSGPISVSTWAYGLNPGTWTVTAELVRDRQSTGLRAGQTLPRARWSWLRWRLSEAPFQPVRTRSSLFVRLGSIPAVVPGSWSALVGLGIVVGIGVLLWLLGFEGVDAPPALAVAVIGVAGGFIGGKLWYMVLRPRNWRESVSEGWSIDGSIVGAIVAAIATMAVLRLPVGAFVDAGGAAFFTGVGIGRLGCFLTGCCAGRCTASRWGIWSSDRRVGARRIPTQLLEAGVGIVLAVASAWASVANVLPDGLAFVIAIGIYLGARQFLLRLRAEARRSSLEIEGRRSATAA